MMIKYAELDRIKRLDLPGLMGECGIKLKHNGNGGYSGLCPFHNDTTPSLKVDRKKGRWLWHCFGCGARGTALDFVMQYEKISFPQAYNKLVNQTGSITQKTRKAPEEPELPQDPVEIVPSTNVNQHLERVIAIYEKNLVDSPEGRAYLEKRGITDAGLFTQHQIGYCNGRLTEILPGRAGSRSREELKEIGILLKNGRERFTGCVVFPVYDPEGKIVTLYGRYTGGGRKRHLFLPGRSTGMWNASVIKTYSEIILVESVLDALSVEIAGYPNVVSIQGTNGRADQIELLAEHGVQRMILLLDGDEAGKKAAERLKERISSSFSCELKTLPEGHDPNSYLMKYGTEGLAAFINSGNLQREPSTVNPSLSSEPPTSDTALTSSQTSADGFTVSYGRRRYTILGLEKGPRKLKATVRVEHAGKLHVDTLDFYSARSRRTLCQDLCRIFEEPPETIEADIARLVVECENQKPQSERKQDQAAVEPLSAGEIAEAEEFGKSDDLIKRILDDFETCGLVGERPNKLLGYLAMTSRKTEEPLSVLIISSSGAGKTALQDTTLAFTPPEDLIKLTSLSGKALFYKEQLSLKHKVLALEEGDGAEGAGYAIRNLITARELVIEATIKDLTTGRLTTMNNRVEGPTAVFITTADPEVDPETKSRFFITSIDESREQTRAILAFQRRRETLDGLRYTKEVDAILRRHRNFQRLLKPLPIVNPYADQLAYGDDRLQGRRDQPKYLNLIKAVAFLRQMSKEARSSRKANGEPFQYIEVELEDIRIANQLAHEILGQSLDELSRPSRDLLMLLDKMVKERADNARERNEDRAEDTNNTPLKFNPARSRVRFSRREIREFTGWSNARVHRYLKELVDFEYVLIDSGRNGTIYRYRLAYEGQGKEGEKFMLGLTPIEKLLKEAG